MRNPVAFKAAPLLGSLTALFFGFSASAAFAVEPAPRLTIHTQPVSSHFSEADSEPCVKEVEKEGEGGLARCDMYVVTLTNAGGRPASGPFTLTDVLPPGVKLVPPVNGRVRLYWAKNMVPYEDAEGFKEAPEGRVAGSCEPEVIPVSCTFENELAPDQRLEMDIRVTVEAGAVSAPNAVSVSEGGKTVASSSENDVIGSTLPPFGASAFAAPIAAADGRPDTQAGDHPYELANRIDLNSRLGSTPVEGLFGATSVEDVRDVVVDLPLGFLGGALATPRCTFAQLHSFPQSCPLDTLVGHLTTEPGTVASANAAVFNMVPEHGVAAEFGFRDGLFGTHEIVGSVAPTPAGYVLRATAREVPQISLTSVITSFFGDPAARQEEVAVQEGKQPTGITPAAMFTNPSDCSGQPLSTTLHMDSWESPGAFNADGTPKLEGPDPGAEGWKSTSYEAPPVTGCNMLRFSPQAFSVKPDTTAGDSPTGLSFDLKIPQSETPGTLATPPLRDVTVTLPAGMTVNPSSANGLQACSEAQIGWVGWGGPGSPGEVGKSAPEFTAAAPACPEASRIGEVHVTSPLVEGTLVGSVYLAAQDENPFHSLLAGYVVIDDPTTGTIVKVPGELQANPETGQITGVFDENPQIPFSELKLRFFSPELATPQACGTFTTTSDLMPWSAPESGPDATPSDSFDIASNCGFGFAPSFEAHMVNPQAAAFSPFTLTIARQDSEQHLSGLTVTTPPGLLGSLAGIPKCSDAQANAGTCPAASQVGETTVTAGVGANPYVVRGGKVFLTGPYNGGPFGLAVLVPAVAGPFNLGNVVVRTSIRINPFTSQITDVSDPFPQMVDSVEGLRSGIPADIRTINVVINRPSFTFNPSSCSAMRVTGSISGAQGATVPVSSPFQAANCQSLPFAPKLTASAAGKASKPNGTTFAVNVTSAGLGQANIAKVDLQLPKALPSRLTTIQKACVAAVFEANPAACNEGSVIGTATIHTPLLTSPLSGPAYLVSHAAASFPDVEFVLQGEGVTLLLDGKTDIKKGITYSRFESTPDAPFTTFATVLPAGPHSILTANVPEKEHFSLCRANLAMPTEITGQNGAVIRQTTKIAVTGCHGVLSTRLTNARLLAKALKACRKDKKKSRRVACEKRARKKYGAKKAAKRAKRR